MRRLVALALAVALSCAPAPSPPQPAPPPPATSIHLSKAIVLEDEALDLDVDPRVTTFSGTATLRVRIAEPTTSIVLHGRDLQIARVVVRDGTGEVTASVATRRALGGREADEELVLQTSRAVVGPATIVIPYSAPFARLRGLYRVRAGNDWYAFTQLEAVDARRMFPSFDEPAFKAPYTLRVTVPQGMVAFSNGALERTEPATAERVRHVFARTAPLPAYLVALAVGPLESIALASGPTPIRLVSTKGHAEQGRAALAETAEYLRILGDYFGHAYPYGKLDVVAVPDFGPGAMENAGLVTFREELLLADAASTSTRRRRSIVLAHELAHQWFGDLVTMRWWDDLWLNEAFATWMAAKACDTRQPGFGGNLDLVSGKLGAMVPDALPAARPVRLPVETSDAIHETGGWSAYQKGAAVLSMIEHWLGEATFRDGIRRYVQAHEHGVVGADDLLGALEAASGKPVTRVATPFLDRTGVPVVEARATCTAQSTLDVVLTAERPGPAPAWPIPACVHQASAQPTCALLESTPTTMHFPTCAPIYGNADEAGYFRVVGGAPLTEAERMATLANAWALVQRGTLDASAFFDAVDRAGLDRETSRLVFEQAIGALGAAGDALVDDATMPDFQRAVRRWLGPKANALGFATKPTDTDDDRLLRVMLVSALWDLGRASDVAVAAEPLARAWLDDPAHADADLGPLAVRISAAAGGVANAAVLRARLPRATAVERTVIVGALASQTSPARLTDVLDLVASGEIRASDFRYVWGAATRTRDGRRIAAKFLRDRFEDLRVALGAVGGLAGSIAWACDDAEQRASVDFFRPKLASFEGMQRSYDEGLEWSRACVSVRGREAGRARAWLARP